MSKKLTHLIAVCLSFLMMATALPNVRFGKTSIPVAYAEEIDEDIDDYPDDEEEEDLRQFNYIQEVFEDAQMEANEETGYVRFTADCYYSNYGSGDDCRDYECIFDPDTMMFSLYIDNELASEDKALVCGGKLNLRVSDSEGNEYYIIDYEDDTEFADLLKWIIDGNEGMPQLENSGAEFLSTRSLFFGFSAIAFVVAVYIVVAKTAERIRAESNYKHNSALSDDICNEYIDNQHGCADFRYGFSNIAESGCGVIAAYNLLVSLGQSELLSEVIYGFEKWGVEIEVSWGSWGSNPFKMYKYFNRKGLRYKKCPSLKTFKNYAKKSKQDNFIITYWNNAEDLSENAHIVHVKRYKEDDITRAASVNYMYHAYNNLDWDNVEGIYNNIEEVIGIGRYIYGYVIYS